MRLLALFLASAVGAFAQITAITAREVDDTAISYEATVTASGDDVRVKYSDNSGFPTTYYGKALTNSSTTKRGVIVGGFDPGDTIYLIFQEDTGSGYADHDCNDSSGSDDLSPDLGGSNWTCNASGYYEVTLQSDQGMTPGSPASLPSETFPTLSGTVTAATSCSDLQTKFNTMKVLTGDGSADAVTVPWDADWTDCSELDFASGITNTDDMAVVSSRYNDNRCPATDEAISLYDDQCAATLRKNGQGTLMELGGSVWVRGIRFATPKPGHSSYTEPGTISALADSGSDRDLTVTGHSVSNSNPIVVYEDPDNPGSCSLEGTYNGASEVTTPDANTVRIIGGAGGTCTGGFVYQDPTASSSTANTLIEFTTSWDGGFYQSIADVRFPARYQFVMEGAEDDNRFVGSVINYGTWAPINGSGNEYLGSVSTTAGTSIAMYLNGVNQRLMKGLLIYGTGITLFTDSTSLSGTRPSNLQFEAIHHVFPDEMLSANHPSELARLGRGHLIELKNGEDILIRGVGQSKVPISPNNANTTGAAVFIRNNSGSTQHDGTLGSLDIKAESVFGYKTAQLLSVEGESGTTIGRVGGRFLFTNLLYNQPTATEEQGQDGHLDAGILFYLINDGFDIRLEKFTKYKGDDEGPFLYFNQAQASRFQVEDYILLGEPRHLQGHIFMLVAQGGSLEPDVTPASTEGAQGFIDTAAVLSGTNSYVRDGVIVCGIEDPGDSYAVAGITAASCLTDYTSTGYTFEDVRDYTSDTSPNTGIAAVGCDDYFDCGDDGGVDEPHSGDEGFDGDALREDMHLFGIHSTATKLMEPTCASSTQISFKVRVPQASKTYTFYYRQQGTTGAYTEVTLSSGSRDRTGTLTGTAGTAYEWVLRSYLDELRGVWTPGSCS